MRKLARIISNRDANSVHSFWHRLQLQVILYQFFAMNVVYFLLQIALANLFFVIRILKHLNTKILKVPFN